MSDVLIGQKSDREAFEAWKRSIPTDRGHTIEGAWQAARDYYAPKLTESGAVEIINRELRRTDESEWMAGNDKNVANIAESGANHSPDTKLHPRYIIGEKAIADCFPNADDETGTYHLDYGNLQALVHTAIGIYENTAKPKHEIYLPPTESNPAQLPKNDVSGSLINSKNVTESK